MLAESVIRVPADTARAQITAILTAWGMEASIVRDTVDVMVETDLSGVDSHGISQLHGYDDLLHAGKLNRHARPRVVRETASTALIDGDAGLGHSVSVAAMQRAIDKAKAHDVGVVSVFNSHHFGAAGYYARMAAEAGLLSMVTSSTRFVAVLPTFGAVPVLGTNPIAMGAPAGRHPPVILDIATSVAAIGKVRVHALRQQALPVGWVSDEQGRAVTDAAEAFSIITQRVEGGLNPVGGAGMALGGHKAYGLSLFSHILGSTLGGGSFSPERVKTQRDDEPDNIGHFFMALNPAAFRDPADFGAALDTVIDTLHDTPPVDPAQPVLVAGDPERLARAERLATGIPMNAALRERIQEIAARCGAPYLLG